MNHFHELEEELKKEFIIDELLKLGIYKWKNRQLFELSLSELEEEYNKLESIIE